MISINSTINNTISQCCSMLLFDFDEMRWFEHFSEVIGLLPSWFHLLRRSLPGAVQAMGWRLFCSTDSSWKFRVSCPWLQQVSPLWEVQLGFRSDQAIAKRVAIWALKYIELVAGAPWFHSGLWTVVSYCTYFHRFGQSCKPPCREPHHVDKWFSGMHPEDILQLSYTQLATAFLGTWFWKGWQSKAW